MLIASTRTLDLYLSGPDTAAFQLNIVGYQYPDTPHERYDSDWLVIEIRVIDRQGDWSSTDPIMLYLDPFRGGFMATMKRQDSLRYPCQVCG